jgi:hypothetical protein
MARWPPARTIWCDLVRLGTLVSVPPGVATDLAVITAAFDAVRYPDMAANIAPVHAIDAATAARDLAAAERVLT